MTLQRRRFLQLVGTIAAFCAGVDVGTAQNFPARSITMIVPFAAGGATDVSARIVSEHMSRTLGQQIVIENVAGAGGTTGSTRAMRANPDGYTIEMGQLGTHAAAVALYPSLAYKPDVDFEPIGMVSGLPIVIVARKDFPPKDLKEFVSFVKANGNKLNVSHAGVGSIFFTTCLAQFDLECETDTRAIQRRRPRHERAGGRPSRLYVQRRGHLRLAAAGRHNQDLCYWNSRAQSEVTERADLQGSWPA
jgi:tripartite-type tricarboxylate transporter receptor subunit TctC